MASSDYVVRAVACPYAPTDHIVLVPFRSIGGSETTSSAMAWWALAMLVYPETQARAQAELDAVVGRARIPTFADYPHLPYIRAMVKETLRWKPVAPLIAPHRLIEDDWYDGMFIPKGTNCIANAWNLNRDPEVYGKNAEHFDPGRYLDGTEEMGPGVAQISREEGHFTYGFGRRNCPGRFMSDNSLFISIAVLLWATKIERKVDASGSLLSLDVDGFVDYGISVSVESPHTFKWMLTRTWVFLQTTGPLRMRYFSALSRCSCPAYTGT